MVERMDYEMEYRCANCGHGFKVMLRKGSEARGAGGECPHCGVKSGRPGIGHHEMVWPTSGNKEILHG